MDGGFIGERRSLSTGLPILSTEPLTAGERATIESLAHAYVHLQARLEGAQRTSTVAAALDALHLLGELGLLAEQAAAALGRNR
jgi:hypothetical protein